jgi:hypothetical protein
MVSIEMGTAYYGLGYLAACAISAALAFAALERTMEDITFLTFRQPPRRFRLSFRALHPRRFLPAMSAVTKLE